MEAGQLATVVVLFVVLVLVVGLSLIMPQLGRRTLFFGVEVDAHFPSSPAARRILRRYRLFIGLGGVVLLAIAAVFSFVPGVRLSDPVPVFVACLIVATAEMVVFSMWGNRQVRELVRGTPAGAEAEVAARHWKAGFIYYNPDDPKTYVEKRFGLGTTLNMARPISWLIVGLPLFFALLLIVVTRLTVK